MLQAQARRCDSDAHTSDVEQAEHLRRMRTLEIRGSMTVSF